MNLLPRVFGSLKNALMRLLALCLLASIVSAAVAQAPVSYSAQMSPTTWNFGSVTVGSQSAEKIFQVTNTGSGALTFSPAVIVTAPYSLSSNTCSATLAAGASCSLGVTFSPTQSGATAGKLLIVQFAEVTALTVASLNGTGVAAGGLTYSAAMSPTTFNFGSVTVGSPSAEQIFQVTNTGNGALTFSPAVIVIAPYSLSSNTCSATLAAGASCSLGVTFSPTQSGATAGKLLIVQFAEVTALTVASLNGTGVASTVIAPFNVSLTAPANLTQVVDTATFSGTVSGSTGTTISYGLILGTANPALMAKSSVQSCINTNCDTTFSATFGWVAGSIQPGDQIATLVVTDSQGRTVSVARTLRVIAGASTVSLDLAQGWNLVGNATDATLDVGTLFADSSRFLTVWKWVAGQSAWAFYAPSLAAQGGTVLADYVNTKGYQLLTTVAAGEGFWVNTKQVTSVTVPSGNPIGIATLGPTLIKGWNLVSVGETLTPKQFCDAQSSGVTTLWAWDATGTAWYFYAPSLDANGGLGTYITSKGYLDFSANSKTLGPGMGFWVNRP